MVDFSAEAWSPWVLPFLSPALAPADAVSNLPTLLRFLPGSSLCALELGLAPESRRLDLAVRLESPAEAHVLARESPSEPVARWLREWAECSWRTESVPAVWLEFDLDPRNGASGLQEASLCARIGPAADRGWLEEVLLPALHGSALTPTQTALFRRCCEALPAGASLLYLFSLRPRGESAVRVELLFGSCETLPAYLERVAPLHAARVLSLLPRIADAERIHLSFDLRPDAMSPRIGLEASYRGLPHREPRWRELFDRLVEAGLCGADRRDAALAWPGVVAARDHLTDWPPAGLAARPFFVRSLSHVKLVSTPREAIEAKIYLLFGGEPGPTPHAGNLA